MPRPSYITVKRVDKVQAELIAAARGVGMVVVNTSTIGRGNPDAVIIRPRDSRAWLVEFKSVGGTLTEPEKDYALRSRVPVHVVRNRAELLELLEIVEYRLGPK